MARRREIGAGITRHQSFWQVQVDAKMEIFDQLKNNHPMVLIAVLGVIALFFALKVGHVILKLVFGLIAFAVIVGGVWWLGFYH
jgi:uncharacterized membrane protein